MSTSRSFVYLLCLGAAPLAVVGAQQSAPVASRVIANDRASAISISVPVRDGRALERGLLRCASGASVGIGLERVLDPQLPERMQRVVRNAQTEVLSGRRLGDALTLISNGVAQYEGTPTTSFRWAETNGRIHVSNIAGATFLDTPVRSFTADNLTLRDLLPRLHRLLDPQFPSYVGSAGSIARGSESADQIQHALSVLERRISFNTSGGTIRDVLDSAIGAHGMASWIVRYADQTGGYPRSEIAFSTFDGFMVELPAGHKN